MDSPLLLAQLVLVSALAGLCWTVQLAVYPLFARLIDAMRPEDFRAYHAAYTRAMGWVAGPLMTLELAAASACVAMAKTSPTAWAGLGLVLAIWALTFVLIVPAHVRLQASPDLATARRIDRLHRLRTALWIARAALLIAVVGGG